MNAGSQDAAGEADGVHHHDQKNTNDQSVPIVSLSVSDEYSASAAEEGEDEEDDYLDDSFEEQPDSGAGGDTIISAQKGVAVAQNGHEKEVGHNYFGNSAIMVSKPRQIILFNKFEQKR